MSLGLDDDVVEIFAAQEAELVPYLIPLTVAGVSRAMGFWLVRNRPEPTAPAEPERSLYLSPTLDDRWVLNGSLDAEGGSVVATALRLATPDRTDLLSSPASRRAHALVDICRFFLDHQQTYAGGQHRPHVNVVVELKDLEANRGGQVVDGPALDGPTIARLFCDSAVHRVVMSGRSGILDYGTATRTIPAPLWNAVVIRDEHCRSPGCDRPSVWCEAVGSLTEARAGQPGVAVLPSPPRPPSARLARQAPTRRRIGGHRSRRDRPRNVAATGRNAMVTRTRVKGARRFPPLSRG